MQLQILGWVCTAQPQRFSEYFIQRNGLWERHILPMVSAAFYKKLYYLETHPINLQFIAGVERTACLCVGGLYLCCCGKRHVCTMKTFKNATQGVRTPQQHAQLAETFVFASWVGPLYIHFRRRLAACARSIGHVERSRPPGAPFIGTCVKSKALIFARFS